MDPAVHYKAPEIMTPLMPGRGKRFTAVKRSSAEQDYLGGEDRAWDRGVLVYLSALLQTSSVKLLVSVSVAPR